MKRLGDSVTFERTSVVRPRLGATVKRLGDSVTFERTGAVTSAGGGGGGGAISR